MCEEVFRVSQFLLEMRSVVLQRSQGTISSMAPTEGAGDLSRSSLVTACRSVYSSSTFLRLVEPLVGESLRPTKMVVTKNSDALRAVGSAPWRPVSESGRLCRGDGGHGRGERRRMALMSPSLRQRPRSCYGNEYSP